MKRIKKVILLFSIILHGLCIVNVLSTKEVYASGNLKVVTKKKVNLKLGNYKIIKIKVYYDGMNVSNYAKIKIKNKKRKVCKAKETFNYTSKAYKNIDVRVNGLGKSIVSYTAFYNPIWKYDKYEIESEIDDLMDEHEEYATREEAEKAFYDAHPEIENKLYKKTIKCIYRVKPYTDLRVGAYLDDYDPNKNVFYMYVYNLSNKTIVINSNDAMVYEEKYKGFDRSVRIAGGKKSVSIKPGEDKTISFKVVGEETSWDVDGYHLYSYWSWGNKSYLVQVSSRYALAYIDNKWKVITR